MSKPLVFLSYPADFKMQMWARRLEDRGAHVILYRSSLRYALAALFYGRLRGGETPVVVTHRYVGDSRSLIGSLLRMGFTMLVTIAARLPKRKLIWFCHNVNRETLEFYPRIIGIRRKLLRKGAHRILVLDPLLVRKAKESLRSIDSGRLGSVSFGAMDQPDRVDHSSRNRTDSSVGELVRQFYEASDAEAWRRAGKPVLVGLCLTNVANKYIHIPLLRRLIEEGEREGYLIKVVLAGNFDSAAERPAQSDIDFFRDDPRVLFVPRVVRLDEQEMRDHFDFIWRAVRDCSVPLTAYVAASVKKPILTVAHGFLPVLVKRFRLGEVIDSEFTNLSVALAKLRRPTSYGFERFLRDRSWQSAADRIYAAAIGEPNSGGNTKPW